MTDVYTDNMARIPSEVNRYAYPFAEVAAIR